MNGNPNLRPTYGCGGEDQKSIFHCVSTALYAVCWIATDYPRHTQATPGPKMINQHFNVYALRRVHCTGYTTAW